MKKNNIFAGSRIEGYPSPLLLTGKELDDIKRGGKICLISLAAGSGHKTMAATVKKLMMDRYKGIVTEDSFFDPNNSAADHPGVWLWNRWQKSESVNWLMLMVRSQRLVDAFHHLGVRLWLPRAMMSAKVTKVIDVQTNSTLSICQAVGDYNDMLKGNWSSLPLYVRFFHGLLDLDYRVNALFWRDDVSGVLTKLLATLLYIPCFIVSAIVSAVVYPISLFFSAISSFWSDGVGKPIPDFHLRGPVNTVKVLTDVPIYDESDRADSTVNYFNALSVLSAKEASRSNLRIISPPVVKQQGGKKMGALKGKEDKEADLWRQCEIFFENPFPQHLQSQVSFSHVKDFLVRDAFKKTQGQLNKALLADPEAKQYGYVVESEQKSVGKKDVLRLSRDPDTLYMSAMLGGNGGVSLLHYATELAEMAKGKGGRHGPKVHFTVFCGGSDEVYDKICKTFHSAQGRMKYKNFTVEPLKKVQDNIIAGVINRAHVHITRPGGISTFELDAMRRSGTLGDTQVLFHTPRSHKDNDSGVVVPKITGLLPWERSNALWFMANRYGVPSSPDHVAKIFEQLSGKTLDLSEPESQFLGLQTKQSLLREGLQQLLVSDGGCKSNSLVYKVLENVTTPKYAKNQVKSVHTQRAKQAIRTFSQSKTVDPRKGERRNPRSKWKRQAHRRGQ